MDVTLLDEQGVELTEIMEAQGGEIWAKPREGGGAEFGFSLRVALDHLEASRGGANGLAAGGATHG